MGALYLPVLLGVPVRAAAQHDGLSGIRTSTVAQKYGFDLYTIDGQVAVDKICLYEDLEEEKDILEAEKALLKQYQTKYAGLTKKDLPRGEWRFLKKEEVVLLKHFK